MSALRKNHEDTVRLHLHDDLETYTEILAGHGRNHEAVIEVDHGDDLTSVRSKLESTSVPRIVLVIPPGVKALSEGIEFRVLRRLQRQLGAELIIVSKDFSRRALARENGFRTAFGSLKAYYRGYSGSRQPDDVTFTDPDEFTPAFSVTRWGLIVGALLAGVLGAIALIGMPTATVTIYPDTQLLARDVDVLVEMGGPRIDVPSQRLAGRLVETRVQVEDRIGVGEAQAAPGSGQTAFQAGTNITLELRDALRDRMIEQATAQARRDLTAQVERFESMPVESIHPEIVSERYDRNIGDVADGLGGTLEMVVRGLVYSNDDFNSLVTTIWSQEIPPQYEASTSPKIEPPAVVSGEGQHLVMRVRASATVRREVDEDEIIAAVRGVGLPEAELQAARAGLFSRPPEIQFWPEWAPAAYRVFVETADPPASRVTGGSTTESPAQATP